MAEKQEINRPSFSAPLWAAARQGAKELSQYLPAFPDSARCVEEPGTLGNPTMQMVTAQMGTLNGFHSVLDQYASYGHDDVYADRKEPEMER
jgi:hypothetical protein